MSDTTSEDFNRQRLSSISEKTPHFVFSKQRVKKRFEEFKKAFPQAEVCYAIKANSEPEILTVLNNSGSSFEVASMHELNYLKEIGVAPERIIYGSSVKPIEHIQYSHNFGITRYAADSFPELEKIASAAPGANVFVRMLANDTGSIFRFSEKFGTPKENIIPLLKHAKDIGLVPYGVSFHVGSQASNPQAWAHALNELAPVLNELQDVHGITLEVINIGGGFPCHYITTEETSDVEEIARYTLEAFSELPYQPKLLLEPGRALVADTGVLIASIIGRVERTENTWLFLDAGVYNGMFEAMAYQGSTRYPITSMRESYDSGEIMYAIAGPTGDSPDVITREALLPRDLEVGDKLIIHKVGAYTLPAISPFNGFPRPDIYYL